MNIDEVHGPTASLEQVYLIERDTGLLCRILGLYAARGMDVRHADYNYAAQDVMTLRVTLTAGNADTVEAVRTLVAKVGSLVGVMAAAEQPSAVRQRSMRPHALARA
jgi:hypothetical protein